MTTRCNSSVCEKCLWIVFDIPRTGRRRWRRWGGGRAPRTVPPPWPQGRPAAVEASRPRPCRLGPSGKLFLTLALFLSLILWYSLLNSVVCCVFLNLEIGYSVNRFVDGTQPSFIALEYSSTDGKNNFSRLWYSKCHKMTASAVGGKSSPSPTNIAMSKNPSTSSKNRRWPLLLRRLNTVGPSRRLNTVCPGDDFSYVLKPVQKLWHILEG